MRRDQASLFWLAVLSVEAVLLGIPAGAIVVAGGHRWSWALVAFIGFIILVSVIGLIHVWWENRSQRPIPSDRVTAAPRGPRAKPRIRMGDPYIISLPIALGSEARLLPEKLPSIALIPFRNEPAVRDKSATARNVRAEVTIFNERWSILRKEHAAFWFTRKKVGSFTALHVAAGVPSTDLSSNGEIRELGIVVRWLWEPPYFLTPQTFTLTGALSPDFKLPIAQLFFRVRLFGSNLQGEEFWFRLTDMQGETMKIETLSRQDAAFAVDLAIREEWLHLVVSNPAEAREFVARADVIPRQIADYGMTPWVVKWRGDPNQTKRVVTQAELDLASFQLPRPLNSSFSAWERGEIHFYSTSLPTGFTIWPGHPSYATGTDAELRELERDLVPVRIETSSVEPKEVVIRTMLLGFDQRGRAVADFLEGAMKDA